MYGMSGPPSTNSLADAIAMMAKAKAEGRQGFQSGFQAQAPQAPQYDYGSAIAQSQQGAMAGRGQQDALIQALQAQAAGQEPSLAQMQLQQATQQGQSAAAGAIASQRGINPAMAARHILDTQAGIGQQAAGQSATLRLQEQLAAREQLGQAIASQRGQDLTMYGQAGQLGQGQSALGVQGSLGTQALNQSTQGQNAANNVSVYGIESGVAAAQKARDDEFNHQLLGGALGGAGAVLGHFGMGKAAGGVIPGSAPVAGDSPKNDTVPARLSPGEIVIPRSIAGADDAPDRAKAFVEAIRAKKQGPIDSYGKLLARHRELDDRLKRIEAMCQGGAVPYAEGGEVEAGSAHASSLWQAIKHMVHAHGEEGQDARKQVADRMSATLPDSVSGRAATQKYNQRWADLDAATKGD